MEEKCCFSVVLSLPFSVSHVLARKRKKEKKRADCSPVPVGNPFKLPASFWGQYVQVKTAERVSLLCGSRLTVRAPGLPGHRARTDAPSHLSVTACLSGDQWNGSKASTGHFWLSPPGLLCPPASQRKEKTASAGGGSTG